VKSAIKAFVFGTHKTNLNVNLFDYEVVISYHREIENERR